MRVFVLSIFLISTIYAKSLFSNNEQVENSKYISALKDLVISTQKTRGLTNSYLNGNESTLLLIYANKKEMKKAIGIMESLPLASDAIVNNRATSISQSLIKLNHKALKKDANSVFEQYTELIAQTLMLAQTVSRHGSKELNPLGKEASIVMMEVILPLCEYVGQLRGMGSGIVAKGNISKSKLNKMSVILSEIESLSSKLQIDMDMILAKYKDKYDLSVSTNLVYIQQATQKYIILTKTEVFKKNISIDANDYFDEGTALISLILKVFNENNKAILEDSKGWI